MSLFNRTPVIVCANCNNKKTDKDDVYCRICGCLFSEKEYNPFNNMVATPCIYGPAPVKRVHSCSCGFSWASFSMVADEKYCPKCGKKCEITEERGNNR